MMATPMIVMDAAEGRRLKKRGIMSAIEHERAEWFDRALRWLRLYAMEHKSEQGNAGFACEAFRARWVGSGFALPHNHHVWGALFTAAESAGYIERTGASVPASSVKTHSHRVQLWRWKK